MYIWIGCQLPADFEQELRSHCLAANQSIGLDPVAFSLPQHISLKISFHAADHQAVLEELTAFLSAQQPFSVRLCHAEQMGNILWLPTGENDTLRQLHEQLDGFLERRFGIPQHEFDKVFLFHSTLFIDERTDKVAAMRDALSGFPLPRELEVNTFLLGLSSDGTAGSYRGVRVIEV